jgi:exodeoxyribonuclease III
MKNSHNFQNFIKKSLKSDNFISPFFPSDKPMYIHGHPYDSVHSYVLENSSDSTTNAKLEKLYTLGTFEKFLQFPKLLTRLETEKIKKIDCGDCSEFFHQLTDQVKETLSGIDIVKIVSWNVNGIRTNIISDGVIAKNGKCKPTEYSISKGSNMDKLISSYHPDIICLQETKCGGDIADCFNISKEFKYVYWSCTKESKQKGRGPGYAGVSIWSKVKANKISTCLPGLQGECHEGRILIAEFNDFTLINVYTPNSGTNEFFRLENWDIAMGKFLKELVQKGKRVVFCGDMNVARGPNDIHEVPKRLTAGYLPLERKHIEGYISKGMIDTFRELYGDEFSDGYTWWNPKIRTMRGQNRGWRIDYFLTSDNVFKKVLANNILKDIMGSDHCPIGLILCK